MLRDVVDTPSRYELLSMARKHSKLLKQIVADDQEPTDVEKDLGFWKDVMDLYFVRGKDSKKRQDDDLLFFVRKKSLPGYGFNDNIEGNSPYFVRRWAPKLNNLVDENTVGVDWRCSYYLNLIAHTSFSVTVAICSRQALQRHQSDEQTPLSPIYKIVKTVYASPSRVNFLLDARKEVETTPAYPDICFAIDDFDSTFDEVVLTDTDHCYCVLLNANGGAAFPSEKAPEDCGSSDSSSLKSKADTRKSNKTKLTLFSGFVSYQMVREAYEEGKSGFGSLLSLGNATGKTDRIYMKGPGGRGQVEVAVSGVLDQSMQVLPHSPGQSSNRRFHFGEIVRRAANVASVAAKHAYAAAGVNHSADFEMLPLKCCLMSISLPWDHIAYDLLFKKSPPVDL
ncbi:Cw7 protein [Heracleum sosnowskyi]|uniref:Cw7 protein n=1 Tax=Heracleum sosnowskyi TaxID=360622 RepID=A0AAD8MBN3_9APIA|nr:Cw7 protein [Heracleum sosnowskyi]